LFISEATLKKSLRKKLLLDSGKILTRQLEVKNQEEADDEKL